MGGVGVKVAIGVFFVALSSQMGKLAEQILGRVRESVQASELSTLDGHLATWAVEQRRTRGPKDQVEFELAVKDLFTERSGRAPTEDRWGQAYIYENLGPRPPAPRWRISSKGPDRRAGTADDLVVERVGDRVTRNRDPVEIAEQALERKQRSDRELIAKLRELTARLEGEGAATPPARDDAAEARERAVMNESLAQLDRLLAG